MDQPLEPRDRAAPPAADAPGRTPDLRPRPAPLPGAPLPGVPMPGMPGDMPPPRGRRRRWLPWLILLVATGAIAFALLRPRPQAGTGAGGGGHRRGAGAQASAAQPVAEATARTGDMPVVLTQLGTVTSLATITVQSQISGYLLEVNFREGQEVHRGDQLALVDPRLYIATLTQDEGNLKRDTATLHEAQIDLARYQLLQRQKSIASQTAEDQVYVVGQAEGAVLLDQGAIASAKQNIAYCHILSPIDGRVGLRQVDAGNYITSAAANGLVVVTQIHPISVIFTIPEDDIPGLQAQMKAGAALPVDAYDRTNTIKLASGSVETIDNTIDTSTGTVRVRANFANADGTLFPNQFVNARLLLQTLHGAVLIPNGAIQTGPQGNFVYLVQPDSTVAVRQIRTGTASTADTVVTTGLEPGDVVVTDGTDKLKTGSKVAVPAAHPPAAAGTGAHGHHRAAADGPAP